MLLDSLWWIFLRLTRSHLGLRIILTVCSCWSQHPTLRKISAEISPQKIHGFGESFLDSLWWIFLRLTRSHLGLRIILTVCSCWSQHPTLRKISAEISPQKIHGFGESFLDSLWWIFLRLTRSHLGYLTFSWTDSIWHFRYPWLLALYSHRLQGYLTFSWTNSIWVFRLPHCVAL